MARVRDEQKFCQCRDSLLAVGQELFINSSFNSVGLNDILKTAGIPKGSFYHYFESKEDFGLQVVEHYAKQNLEALEAYLASGAMPAKWIQTESKLFTSADDNEAIFNMKKDLGY